MGKRGTKKTPAGVKKLLGTYRDDRDGGTPEVPLEVPAMPPWLSEDAQKYWREIAPWLEKYKILTRLDGVALALLSMSLCDLLVARENGDKSDENKAHGRVEKLLREFGMTPSARAGLKIKDGQSKDDPLAKFGVVA